MGYKQSIEKKVRSYYDEKRALVEDKIKEWIEDLPFLKNLAYKALEGGKRFRGVLTLLICEALQGNLEEAVEYAASIEFTHAATLLHDDVLDSHIFRRGKYSFWKVYNIHEAIIAGDFLFTYAGYRVSRISNKALSIISRAIYRTTLGILLESIPSNYPGPIKEIYYEVIKLKTGELIAGAAELGALATHDHSKMMYAYRYGLLLGEAYQIADDIYDLKTSFADSSNVDTKPIKLAIISLANLSDDEAEDLWKINDANKVIQIAKETSIDQKMEKLLKLKLDSIDKLLTHFPNTPLKKIISFIPRYIIEAMIKYG